MALKALLAPISGYEENEAALVVGFRLARKLGAFVDVLHVRPDPRDAIPLVPDASVGAVAARIYELAEQEGKERARRARKLYEDACKKARVVTEGAKAAARFRIMVGRAAAIVPQRGRVADLILLGRVPEAAGAYWQLTLEAALLESGRPVLLLPAASQVPVARSVAIAWNGSVEAARAASAALPILAKAARVLLLAGEKDRPIEPSLAEFAEWLDRHRIAAAVETVALKGWPVGERLVADAVAAGADLLVMGAYGRSRMRETIFGGATRSVLHESALPVLMAH